MENKRNDFSAKALEKDIKNWIKENELGFGQVMPPLRLSLVGALKGPDLFEILEMTGKKETVKRIEKFIKLHK